MRRWQKALISAVLAPVLVVAGYIVYLWATYLDKTITSGSAYGFEIGASKQQTLTSSGRLPNYPGAVLYVSYGPRAGDNFSIPPLPSNLPQLQLHDNWEVLLDGKGEFSNIIRLKFRDDRLIEIYRHRQNFELP
jgi:hypothetical protein